MKKIALVIDAAYLLKCAQSYKIQVDFIKLKATLERESQGKIVEGHYFNSAPNVPSVARFHKWLQCAAPAGPQLQVHEYSYKSMAVSCHGCGCSTSRTVQKGVDVAIALKVVKMSQRFDSIILVAGDGDLKDALETVREMPGKEIILAAFSHSASPELRMLSNKVIWLDEYCQSYQRHCA